MAMFSKQTLVCLGVGSVLLAGCLGNDDPQSLSVQSAVSDGQVTQSEAALLLDTRTESGEPESLDNVTLQTSETTEPFDL